MATAADGVEVPFGEELLRDCLASFPHVRLTVTGRCMEPAIAHGEKVQLVSAARRRAARRATSCCRGRRRACGCTGWCSGRRIALPGSRWRTKADRGLLLDPPLAARDVLAKVVSVEGRPERAAAARAAGARLARARRRGARARPRAQGAEALS